MKMILFILMLPVLLTGCKERTPFYVESEYSGSVAESSFLDAHNGLKFIKLGSDFQNLKQYLKNPKESRLDYDMYKFTPAALEILLSDSLKVNALECTFFQDKLMAFEIKINNKPESFDLFQKLERAYGEVLPTIDSDNYNEYEVYKWKGQNVELVFTANKAGSATVKYSSLPLINAWLNYEDLKDKQKSDRAVKELE